MGKNNNDSNAEIVKPIFPFLKIEMVSKKDQVKEIKEDNLKIDFFMSKYIPNALKEKSLSMTDEEKAKIYYWIGEKLYVEPFFSDSERLYVIRLVQKFLKRALTFMPNNKEYAYRLFEVCRDKNASVYGDELGVEVADIYLKLSGNKDAEDKFYQIYDYLGHYYFFEKYNYKKALEYFKKVQEYSNKKDYWYQESFRYIGLSNYYLGNYKEALEAFNHMDDLKGGVTEVYDIYIDVKEKVAKNITKAQADEKIFKEGIDKEFSRFLNKYPEKYLLEAYKHYYKAENLIKEYKNFEAVDEYEIVEMMLPEMHYKISDLIKIYGSWGPKIEKPYDYHREMLEILNEKLEIAQITSNKKDLCHIYNVMAVSYSELKRYKESLDYYKKAVGIAGIASEYGINLARYYIDLGLYDKALNLYKKIQEEDSSFAEKNKIEKEISNIKDIKLGKIGKNGEDCKKIFEFSQKGDEYFNKGMYNWAYSYYSKAGSFCESGEELIYDIKWLISVEMHSCFYTGEKYCYRTILNMEKYDDLQYLPFLFTIYGDYLAYTRYVYENLIFSQIFYEIAIYLLNLIPISERFAAPYYKLARLKEKGKEYKEALSLYQLANEIDKSYNIEKDVLRVKSKSEDGGKRISDEVEKLIINMKSYLENKQFLEVINTGKEALNYVQDNIEIYYMICKAAEEEKQYYELKWSAMEAMKFGIKCNKPVFDRPKTDRCYYYEYFLWFLAQSCKYEKKMVLVEDCYNQIVNLSEYRNNEIIQKAKEELWNMNSK